MVAPRVSRVPRVLAVPIDSIRPLAMKVGPGVQSDVERWCVERWTEGRKVKLSIWASQREAYYAMWQEAGSGICMVHVDENGKETVTPW